MVEKPLDCLEYIILHELVHLKVSNHGKEFTSMMDKYMPDWKDRKNLLNGQILDSYKAQAYNYPKVDDFIFPQSS